MARIRTIKPEFPQSESMGRVSRDARLLFIQLWTLADDSGRLRGNSRMLASLLFPYDEDAPSLISGWLTELEDQNCILRYVADDGGSYVQVCNWSEHQKIDKASKSKLPEPSEDSIRESSRRLANPLEASIPSRARADQGPRTKDQGSGTCTALSPTTTLPPPSAPPSGKFPNFPCVRGKKSDSDVWVCEESYLQELGEVFPGVDVMAEARKAHAWVSSRESHRKTAGGMKDFLRRWFAKAQDAGANARASPRKTQSQPQDDRPMPRMV